MTRKRNDSHSTEFGLWLRKQKRIDSKLGYSAINLDYIWRNYKTGEWLLIEEKRYMSNLTFPQKQTFKFIDMVAKSNPKYKGFFLIQFQNTNPDDGEIFINGKQSTVEDLFDLLIFKEQTNEH